jgi:hypothetical protein
MNFRVLRSLIVASMIEGVLALSACGDNTGPPAGPTPPPTAPSPAPAPRPAPTPNPTFPSIAIGDVVRFSFAVDDTPCVGGGGRCRSYNVTVPVDGTLQGVLTSVSGTDAFIATTEMYVVPGGDSWDIGPGSGISVTVAVKAGSTYEIRMYSARIPSEELELRTSLR